MVNPKCKSCDRYIGVIELKSSGEPYKSCNKCRDIQKKIYNNKKIKEPELKEDSNIKNDDIGYEIEGKMLNKELLLEWYKMYCEKILEPDEVIEIPKYCFKYVIGVKQQVIPESD